ncbi:MAG: methyltransferase domain-containing protein [Anaerolineae bacterium]|nr:methyltransferase domain-containing protein [Anaerolineae bacterium]
MTITYNEVKPWGRLFSEYVGMFGLTEDDLRKRILGCGDGPASFNAEATEKGYRVTSVDPIYVMTAAQIEQRVSETWQEILAQMRGNMDAYVWTKFKTVDEVGAARLSAMRQFVADLEQGKREGRYIDASLPSLPFEDGRFDLALCSNFLFMYSDHLSTTFHIDAVREMCRVAREVRIFPLLDLTNRESVHLAPVIAAMAQEGWQAERVPVDYEFFLGANKMLRVYRSDVN